MEKPVLGNAFPLCSGLAVIAVRIDRDPSARRELAPDLNILGIHELYQILHYYVDAVLMKVAVVPEREEIELQ